MNSFRGLRKPPTRRAMLATAGSFLLARSAQVQASNSKSLDERFDFLSKNGNSSCTAAFLDSIAKMPKGAKLQGSCCSEMERSRYEAQITGLAKYGAIVDIPPDPYDIEASLAAKLITYYDLALKPEEQKAYDFAMTNSEEKGPCCCRCWRWKVYGGLAKLLIREHGFDGGQIVEVWNLSDGCGGAG